MIKLILKLCLVCSFIFANVSQATFIVSDDSYISYNLDGVAYDIAWASSVNSERYYVGGANILLKPNTYAGWGFATPDQLVLLSDLGLSGTLLEDLTRSDGSYIHAFDYWNDAYKAPVDTRDIDDGLIGSQWVWSIANDGGTYAEGTMPQILEIVNRTNSGYDTFYIRVSQVPEPSTLMIFALGLITLVSKKKLFS